MFSDNGDYTKMSNISKDLLFASSSTATITKNFDSLLFPSNSASQSTVNKFDLNGFNGLRSVTVEDNNFPSANQVRAVGMPTLTTMSVGRNSFTSRLRKRLLSEEEDDSDGSFVIADCPQLRSLSIGPESFSEFNSFNASSTCEVCS